MTRLRRLGDAMLERGYALGLATLALYLWLAPTTIVDGDNAEMSTLAVLGGRAHPSGYPLYVLWLRATSWLPGESAAHTAALATAILGAAAVVALFKACRAWGARAPAATLATAMYAASPLVLIWHTQAEVFALNALVVATVLWLAAAAGPVRGIRRATLLALVAGLGMSDHLTCVFAAPVGLYGLYLGVREAPQRTVVVLAAALGGLALGLAPYIYLALAPDTAISWGHSAGLGDVLAHALRRDYGSLSFAPHGAIAPLSASLIAAGRGVGRAWWWLPGAIGLATLAWLSVRRRAGESRVPWIALALSTLLAGPLFVSRFNLMPEGLFLHMLQRFYLLPILLLGVPVAVGLDRLAGARVALARSPFGALLGVLALPVLAAPALAPTRAEHTTAMETAIINTLRALPPNAAMITNADDFAFGVIYVQQVLGVRRDVISITWPMMSYDWYRDRAAARGATFDPSPSNDPASVRLATQLLATGHPVYVDEGASRILNTFPAYPFAGFLHVLPRGAPLPGVDAIAAENREAYAKFDLDYPTPGPDDGYPTIANMRYAATWYRIAKAYADAGFPAAAKAARDTAHAFSVEP